MSIMTEHKCPTDADEYYCICETCDRTTKLLILVDTDQNEYEHECKTCKRTYQFGG